MSASDTPAALPAPLLSIQNLSIDYVGERSIRAVDDLSLDLYAGEIFGLLGESGSGKSTAALGALRLLPPPAVIRGGQVLFQGHDLLQASEAELRRLRFRQLAVVLQSAMNALSPVLTIGEQIADVIVTHEELEEGAGRQSALGRGVLGRGEAWRSAWERSAELLSLVGIPAERLRSHPHQLSGGMRQRVTIAMALALRPSLLVLDEPTTALDVLVEREILQQVVELRDRLGFSVLIVSHDVGVLLEFCDRLGVLYAGRLCEVGRREELARGGRHPYTRALLASLPRLSGERAGGIPGRPPDLVRPPPGCRFHPRCAARSDDCAVRLPELRLHAEQSWLACHHPLTLAGAGSAASASTDSPTEAPGSAAIASASDSGPPTAPASVRAPSSSSPVRARAATGSPLFAARGLVKVFARREGWTSRSVRVVDDVSLEVWPGEVVALVGQSGSGKSTILRMLAGLLSPTDGEVLLGGERVIGPKQKASLAFRKRVQIILQDPFASLNPVHTVGYNLERPLLLHRLAAPGEVRARACELLERVGLSPPAAFVDKRPHELSGGQRQRVAIARALAVQAEVILADEPTSMLDVSVRAGILELIADLRQERGLAVVYVTHDLASARALSDRLLVLSGGRIVESGPTESVLSAPEHAYTQRLLGAATRPS